MSHKPLKAEFHCHAKLLGQVPFKPVYLERRLNRARALGLDVLAITEHLEAPDYQEIYRCLEALCRNDSGTARWHGVTVLTGAEITISSGQDILLIGGTGYIKELVKRLGFYPGNPPRFEELMDASEDLELLRVGAHPCRRGKCLWSLGPQLKRLDALEINASELSKASYVQEQAQQLGLPVLAGSDAHHWLQIGRVYNILPLHDRFTIPELKQTVLQRQSAWQKKNSFAFWKNMLFKPRLPIL